MPLDRGDTHISHGQICALGFKLMHRTTRVSSSEMLGLVATDSSGGKVYRLGSFRKEISLVESPTLPARRPRETVPGFGIAVKRLAWGAVSLSF